MQRLTGDFPTLCRICNARCPATVTMANGEPVAVRGNPKAPLYAGFFCSRGQSMIEQLRSPNRLLRPLKRNEKGNFDAITADVALDEIATSVERLVQDHGPESVALYTGTHASANLATGPIAAAFFRALQSPMVFGTGTIDQPGKQIGHALAGSWEAGPHTLAGSDVWLIIGGNPLVSILGALTNQNPARHLTDSIKRGLKLIVIDPRKTETASRAHLHLQPRPGQDVAVIAAMIQVIIEERRYDDAFVKDNVRGLEDLRNAVAPYTPDVAARRADVGAEQIREAARIFATGKRGLAVGGTGANMAGRSTLVEYLIYCMNILCGRFLREGELIPNPGVLIPRAFPRAQPTAPRPPTTPELPLSVRGLSMTPLGMPSAALADEILSGRIRALISVGGNPVAALPDQGRTIEAFRRLDLLIQMDVRMSASAKLAHYVLPPRTLLELPACTLTTEALDFFWQSWSFPQPFGMYAPKLMDPPIGAELIDEWELFYHLAQRLRLQLSHNFPRASWDGPEREFRTPIHIDMQNKPTNELLVELLTYGGRIALSEVKRFPDGALFPDDVPVAARAPDCQAKLDVGAEPMIEELAEVATEPTGSSQEFPFQLVSRRLPHVYNSSGRDIPSLVRKGGAFNPASMNPDDMTRMALATGDQVVIRSNYGEIRGIVAADPTLRPGLLAMAHCFGDLPESAASVHLAGSNTGQLLSVEDGYDRYSGIPRMSALPVHVSRHRDP